MTNELSTEGRRRKKRGRRDWVKNAIIIFLAVLLVLTFFSNTIMNYSLPEVAAQYPQSTTLTTKIRGSGTVESAQSYNVTVQETRTVAAVNVKKGDTIAAGDTLLTLDATESQELQDARTNLATVKLDYEKLKLPKNEEGAAAQAASLAQAQAAVTKAESDLATAQKYESDLKWYQDQEASAKSTLATKNQNKDYYASLVDNLSSQIGNVENTNADYLSAKKRLEDDPENEELKAEVQRIYDEQIAPQIASLTNQLAEAQQNLLNATYAASQAESAYTSAQDATASFQSSNQDAASVSAAQSALQSAKDNLATLQATAKDTENTNAYNDSVAQLDLAAKEQEVKDAEAKVKALEEKTSAANIKSRYAGVVTEVNVAAGDTTTADTPLMVVELTEKGYTLKATVTKEQARTLKEGLQAEITNLWDSGITMTLTSITSDKNDPANSRVLTFAVTGDDVSVGQSLSFSVGDKNSNYDLVIPSAAIHTDADGSFVYTVQVKSSPLGNRYTVRKKTVTIVASDDNNSAVSGELSSDDFVITTATVPLKVGTQVRIAE
ncbi:MAG: HlyD family efflux transporter periplasmic adaptor subunit [Oscillospiraceae bacterium]|nr:HlyD family efflux transporter periplasmic adaptor subunit [Oscillospiraceae bacterium]